MKRLTTKQASLLLIFKYLIAISISAATFACNSNSNSDSETSSTSSHETETLENSPSWGIAKPKIEMPTIEEDTIKPTRKYPIVKVKKLAYYLCDSSILKKDLQEELRKINYFPREDRAAEGGSEWLDYLNYDIAEKIIKAKNNPYMFDPKFKIFEGDLISSDLKIRIVFWNSWESTTSCANMAAVVLWKSENDSTFSQFYPQGQDKSLIYEGGPMLRIYSVKIKNKTVYLVADEAYYCMGRQYIGMRALKIGKNKISLASIFKEKDKALTDRIESETNPSNLEKYRFKPDQYIIHYNDSTKTIYIPELTDAGKLKYFKYRLKGDYFEAVKTGVKQK